MISVIVPIYNAEKHLHMCLNSLINQTEANIEIICVDDGSTDSSMDILREFTKKDDRIIAVRQKNSGVSTARNNGIQNASGDFIMFVDADDWIDADTCEFILKELRLSNADIVMWPYIREYGNKSLKKQIYSKNRIVFLNDGVKKLHRRYVGMIGEELSAPENIDALNPVCTKLYRRSLLVDNHVKFQSGQTVGEDLLFNLNAFAYAKCVVYVNKYMYHYRRDDVDSQTRSYRPNLTIQFNKLHSSIYEYLKVNHLKGTYYEALSNRIALSLIGLGLNIAGGV